MACVGIRLKTGPIGVHRFSRSLTTDSRPARPVAVTCDIASGGSGLIKGQVVSVWTPAFMQRYGLAVAREKSGMARRF
jgi:hypothetical protein